MSLRVDKHKGRVGVYERTRTAAGTTQTPLWMRKAKRRRANVIAKASRRRNRS